MEIRYKLTDKDYFASLALHARRGILPYLSRLLFFYGMPILGGAACVFALVTVSWSHWKRFNWTLFIGGFIWLLLPLYLRWAYRRQFRRSQSHSGENLLNLDSEMLRHQGAHAKGEMEWAAFQRSAEDKKSFLLYLAPGKFLVIPKRVLPTEQVEELRALLLAKVVKHASYL